MGRRFKRRTDEEHRALHDRSGWWLAAWRDYRELTLEALAAKVASSKGEVSALETGGSPSKPRGYNRNWVEVFAHALDCSRGDLFDVNPFTRAEEQARRAEEVRELTERLLRRA